MGDLQRTEAQGGSPKLPEGLATGGVWAVLAKGAALASSLAVNALLARLLSPEEAGAYFLTFSMVTMAQTAASLGLTRTAVRLVAESMGADQPGRARGVVVTILRYGTLGALCMSGVLISGIGNWLATHLFHSQLMAGVVHLAALWVFVMSLQSLLAEILRGFRDIRLATLFSGPVRNVLTTCLLAAIWLARGQSSLHQVLVISASSGAIAALLSGWLLRLRVLALPRAAMGGGVLAGPQAKPLGASDRPSATDRLSDRQVLDIARPLWVVSLSVVALRQAGIWIMGAFASQGDVALYGAAARLVNMVGTSQALVVAVVPPWIASMHARGEIQALERMLRLTALLAGIPSVLVLLVFAIFGRSVLGLLYGDFYQGAMVTLLILSVGQMFDVYAGTCQVTLTMVGHQVLAMWNTIISGIVTVVLALLLVGKYGATGVATATATGLILQKVTALLAVRWKTGIWTSMGRPSAAWQLTETARQDLARSWRAAAGKVRSPRGPSE